MGALTQLFFVSGVAPSGTAVNYSPLVSGTGDGSSFATTATSVQVPIPIAGRFRTLAVQVPAASLTAGQSFDVALVVNNVASSLVATVDSTHNTIIATGNVAIAVGDRVWLQWTPTGSPTTTSWVVSAAIVFEATASDHYIIPAYVNNSTTSTGSLAIGARNNIGGASYVFPCAGTINGISVMSNATNSGAAYMSYVVRKNGVDQSMIAIDNGAANTAFASTGAAVSVAAGDTLGLVRTVNGAPSAQITSGCIDWTPTNPGDFPAFSTGGTVSFGSSQTYPLSLGTSALNSGAADSTVQCIVAERFTATNLAILVSSAAVTGRHRLGTLRKNGADSGVPAVDLTGTGVVNVVGSTGSASWAANDNFNFYQVPTGTPAATVLRLAATLNMGGTTYNDTLTESLTAATTLATVITFPNTLSEGVTGAANLATIATFPNALSEALTAADSLATAVTFSNALSEALTATDSLANVATFLNAFTENLTSADVLSSSQTMNAALSENATAGHSFNTTAVLNITLNETITADHSFDTTAVLNADYVETMTLGDDVTAGAILSAELSETLVASVVEASFIVIGEQIEETLFPDDDLISSAVFESSITETISAGFVISEGTPIKAPPDRIVTVDAEVRIIPVDAEYRLTAVDVEYRWVTVDAEDRMITVDAENRSANA